MFVIKLFSVSLNRNVTGYRLNILHECNKNKLSEIAKRDECDTERGHAEQFLPSHECGFGMKSQTQTSV